MSYDNVFKESQSYETEAVIPPQTDVRSNVTKLGMMKNVHMRRNKIN
jgi:hypothetical protein